MKIADIERIREECIWFRDSDDGDKPVFRDDRGQELYDLLGELIGYRRLVEYIYVHQFRKSAEYGAGDEWNVDEWTIASEPRHVRAVGDAGRKLMVRTVYYGPWEEVNPRA